MVKACICSNNTITLYQKRNSRRLLDHHVDVSRGEREAVRRQDYERENFLERYETERCVQFGSVMNEYVMVPDTLQSKTQEARTGILPPNKSSGRLS
jgi:hypothetical protein